MTPQPGATAGRERRLRRLRGLVRPGRLRLVTGLVLFAFALSHFLNHALGLVSLDAMEAAQAWRSGFWRSAPGTVLLYGSLLVHAALGLWTTLRRRTWRLPPWQITQVALGLAIPVLGAAHVAGTRGLAEIAGQSDAYRPVLDRLWPEAAPWQAAFLLAVWVHAAIGLRLWLREKAWYPRLAPMLLSAACLVPVLALAGWMEAARRLPLEGGAGPPGPVLTPDEAALPGLAIQVAWAGLGLVAALLLALRAGERLRRGPLVRYPDGRQVRVKPGATLLETSLSAGIPHAAACGGRGRCTTCRVAVVEGLEGLPEPNATEAAALARIHAPPGVRLACQVRPGAPLAVRLLVPAAEAPAHAVADPVRWGVERRITVLFADLRGFTSLAERLYPYDAVFLLNRYFELMSRAVEAEGGIVDKFLGDGIMALFGTARGVPDAGAAGALRAARAMLDALDTLNHEFQGTTRDAIRMGIGIHVGPVVLGRVGGREGAGAPPLTALGDSVNVASRLEALNKEFASILVVSQATLDAAGLALPRAGTREVPLRGRAAALRVAVAVERDEVETAPAAPAREPRAAAAGATAPLSP